MPPATDFTYARNADGTVVISHRGAVATRLRGDAAIQFLADVDGADLQAAQDLMARVTGQYRRGNERTAKSHPRNR